MSDTKIIELQLANAWNQTCLFDEHKLLKEKSKNSTTENLYFNLSPMHKSYSTTKLVADLQSALDENHNIPLKNVHENGSPQKIICNMSKLIKKRQVRSEDGK